MITKRFMYTVALALGAVTSSLAQDGEVIENDSIVKMAQGAQEPEEMQAQIAEAEKEAENAEKAAKKAEKEAKKAEKAQKKLEKQAKKIEDLKEDINDTKEDIAKGNRKVNQLEEDMELDKITGKLSPNDIDKINNKIEKEKLRVVKDKGKLRKMENKLRKS